MASASYPTSTTGCRSWTFTSTRMIQQVTVGKWGMKNIPPIWIRGTTLPVVTQQDVKPVQLTEIVGISWTGGCSPEQIRPLRFIFELMPGRMTPVTVVPLIIPVVYFVIMMTVTGRRAIHTRSESRYIQPLADH